MGSASGSAATGTEAHPPMQPSRGGRGNGGPPAQRLAGVVFAGLVLACFAAFAVTQRLKHSPTAVQNFMMDRAFQPARAPAAACRGRVPRQLVNASKQIEYLSFKTAQADAVTVQVVDSAGDAVATIVRALPVERYKQLSLCWNGHRGAAQRGRLAPPGEYRVQVSLRRQQLTRLSPNSFTLESRRP
jgi:hypothetical protein